MYKIPLNALRGFSRGEVLLLNWFTKSFKFSEGFNKKELSLFQVLTGLLLLWKLLTHMETFYYFS